MKTKICDCIQQQQQQQIRMSSICARLHGFLRPLRFVIVYNLIYFMVLKIEKQTIAHVDMRDFGS